MMERLKTIYRLCRDTAGSSAVEMAFVMPVLIALTGSVVDGGRALFAYNTVEKVAKEGARFASVRGIENPTPATEADIKAFVKSQASGLSIADDDVTVVWGPGGNVPGSPVTVTVSFQYDTILIDFLHMDGWNLASSATLNVMR